MYKIALCDDDSVFLSEFIELLSNVLTARNVSCHLTLFSDIPALQQSIENGQTYDLIFLDIYFDKKNGIDFAEFLRKKKWNTDIIFVTSSADYAVASYEVAPLHYLLKPIEQNRLEAAVERFLKKREPRSIYFPTSKGVLHIFLSHILYCEIYSHDITIHKTDGTKETCTGSLKDIERLLPSLSFVRPHRSYLVNFEHVSEITRYRIRLSSGEMIPVSKALYNKVQSCFIDYASQKGSVF